VSLLQDARGGSEEAHDDFCLPVDDLVMTVERLLDGGHFALERLAMSRGLLFAITILFMFQTANAETVATAVPDSASLFMLGWGAAAAVFGRKMKALRATVAAHHCAASRGSASLR
jgi:hypothetical protein